MPLWSAYEIELLIREIEEIQCFWNMFNSEYEDRIKKLDALKEVSEVLRSRSNGENLLLTI